MAAATRFLPYAAAAVGTAAFSAPLLLDSSSAAASVTSPGAALAKVVRPGRDVSGDKLPIYHTSEPRVTLIETSSPISPYITQAREATQEAFAGAGTYVEGGVSKWIGFERKVEREIKSVLPADESLNPGAIYVLISGLTGSVLTRTRSLPIRLLAPPLFTLLSAPYFLPRTSASIRSYLSNVEDAHFPALASAHDNLNKHISGSVYAARDAAQGAGDKVEGWGKVAVREVESATGLRVGEVGEKIKTAGERGRGEVVRRVEEAKAKARAAEREVGLAQGQGQGQGQGQELQTVGYVVEQKPVAEIVAPVKVDKVEEKKESAKRLV